MFLRILSAMNSLVPKRSYNLAPDDIVNWQGEKEAQRLIKRGLAEEIGNQKRAEEMSGIVGRLVKSIPPDKDFEDRLDPKTLETQLEVQMREENERYLEDLRNGRIDNGRRGGEAAMRAQPAYR